MYLFNRRVCVTYDPFSAAGSPIAVRSAVTKLLQVAGTGTVAYKTGTTVTSSVTILG